MARMAPNFVYVYRHPLTRAIRYVGVGTYRNGKMIQRPEDHPTKSPHREFKDWIRRWSEKDLPPVVEYIPCASAAEAFAVEAALISALWTPREDRGDDIGLFNAIHGHKKRFVLLGLEPELQNRRDERVLTREDFAVHGGGALVVKVSNQYFADEADPRAGATLRSAVIDDEIRARTVKFWQLGGLYRQWQQSGRFPRAIVSVAGPPGHQWVWGSIAMTRADWRRAKETADKRSDGLFELDPHSTNIDYRRWRGRRVEYGQVGALESKNGHRYFGSWRSQFFDYVEGHS